MVEHSPKILASEEKFTTTIIPHLDCCLSLCGFHTMIIFSSLYLLLGEQDQQLGAEQGQLPTGSTGTSSGSCQKTNFHGFGTSHAMTTSPEPSFRTPWKVVGRGIAGWTTSKSGHPCLCQNCSQGPPAEKDWKRPLLNHPSCSPQ